MAQKRPKVGDLVVVTFYDHAEDSKDVLLFEVIGRLTKITRKGYTVCSWAYVNDVDRAGDDNPDNEKTFSIVKKAIDSIKVLK